MTPVTILGVATVYACVNATSRSMSSVPLKLYEEQTDGTKKIALGDPLHRLMHKRPNPEMTSSTFWRTMQANATLRNEAYALIVRNGLGDPVEIWPIENRHIRADRDGQGNLTHYLRRDDRSITEERITDDRLIRIVGATFNGVRGINVPFVLRDVFGLAIALQDNAARFFGNGSRPGLILEHERQLDPEQRENLKKAVKQRTGGENAYSLLLLEGGLKLAANAAARTSNRDSQMNEERRAQDKQICAVFGVQPHKVGILDDAKYANVEQQGIDYVTDVMLPWSIAVEQELDAKLLGSRGRENKFFKFILDGLQRADITSRYNAYGRGILDGWMTRNDARRFENLDPLPGLDRPLIPLNMGEVDEDGQTLINTDGRDMLLRNNGGQSTDRAVIPVNRLTPILNGHANGKH